MEFNRQVNRRLHEEHEATLELCARLERGLSAASRTWPPAPEDSEAARLLRGAAVALADEVARHFAFEEADLFPRLAEAGDGELAELLAEEHAVIRSVSQRFTELEIAMREGTLDVAGWQQLRVHALELAERLASHAQKEEVSLLPALEDLLDDDSDRELLSAYVLH